MCGCEVFTIMIQDRFRHEKKCKNNISEIPSDKSEPEELIHFDHQPVYYASDSDSLQAIAELINSTSSIPGYKNLEACNLVADLKLCVQKQIGFYMQTSHFVAYWQNPLLLTVILTKDWHQLRRHKARSTAHSNFHRFFVELSLH